MTKTQKKAQEYIINTIDSEPYDVVTKTEEEKVLFLYATFINEMGWNISNLGLQNSLTEWFQGLPTVFPLAFTNYDILELAKKWGTLEANPSEAKEDRYLKMYWNMLASNAISLFKKYDVV
jgi:hypothetical protein